MAWRLLIVSADNYPVMRVDVSELFGVEMVARGYTVDLIVQSEAPCAAAYLGSWEGGSVWVGATDPGTRLWRRLRKHLLGIGADLKLFPWLRSGAYDLLIVKDKFLSGVLGLLAARLYHRPFIYWLSYPFPEAYLERARSGSARYPILYAIRGRVFHVLLYRWLLPRADHVLVQSAQMRRDVVAEGIAADKISAVPMGIQPQMFPVRATSPTRRLLPAGVPCIVYLGSLGRPRQLDFLLRVLVRLHRRMPVARLYLVGRGDEPSDDEFLAREVQRLGLGAAVVLTGQLPRAAALDYVAEADVCVSPLPPSRELNAASPTKLVEYMAMSKAVVANDHPDQQLLIEESGAGLCVPYDEQAFADALERLLADPESARRMGERGRPYVLEHRTYAVIGAEVEAQLRRTIERARRPA